MCVSFCRLFVSFKLHAVSITRRFQYMPFPVSSYPPFPLLAVSSSHVLHTVSITRAFSVPMWIPLHFDTLNIIFHSQNIFEFNRLFGALCGAFWWRIIMHQFINGTGATMAVYSIDLAHRPTSSLADIFIAALCTLPISSKNLAFNDLQMWLLAAVRFVNSIQFSK